MIDKIGRMRMLEEKIDATISSKPTEGQSKVANIVWDNELQKVEVQKESEEE